MLNEWQFFQCIWAEIQVAAAQTQIPIRHSDIYKLLTVDSASTPWTD